MFKLSETSLLLLQHYFYLLFLVFTEEISRYSGLLVCSLARGVELELTGVKDEIKEKDEFSRKDCSEMDISGTDCSGEDIFEKDVSEEPGLTPVCRKCHGQIKHKGGNVEFNSIQPLFKLIGGLLKGVFAKNERGYRLNAIKKRF